MRKIQTITLDALIPREDFNILSSTGSSGNTRNKTTLSIEDLKYDSFFFSALGKPIFQRDNLFIQNAPVIRGVFVQLYLYYGILSSCNSD
jgi:hypothetical protein